MCYAKTTDTAQFFRFRLYKLQNSELNGHPEMKEVRGQQFLRGSFLWLNPNILLWAVDEQQPFKRFKLRCNHSQCHCFVACQITLWIYASCIYLHFLAVLCIFMKPSSGFLSTGKMQSLVVAILGGGFKICATDFDVYVQNHLSRW